MENTFRKSFLFLIFHTNFLADDNFILMVTTYPRLEPRADFTSLCSGMSPSEVECCFKQMLNGVSYLHSQGVAHRDIKPENLFFDTKGHLKVLYLVNMVACWCV